MDQGLQTKYTINDKHKRTCLICFTCTSHPVHWVPLLTPTHFGFQNRRKSTKDNTFFSIRALSSGINSYSVCTLCCNKILVQNSTQNHTFSEPMDQTPKFFVTTASHIQLPPPLFLLTCLYWYVFACMHMVMCVCVHVCVLRNEWMYNFLKFILCCSILSLLLLL